MINMTRKLIIAFCICGFARGSMAQETIPASGGNATGSGGTVSYTVGQVAYTTITASSGTITEGVQQPVEIFIVTSIEEASEISLIWSAYPNPASDFIKLNVENYKLKNLTYQLFDISGKLILTKKIDTNETYISLENIAASTYLLIVTENQKEIKIFKIVKTQ